MLNEKSIPPDLKQNPGMIIGKEQMAQFIAFVKKIPDIDSEKTRTQNMS